MLTAEDMKALSDLIDKKIDPIYERLDGMDQRLDAMDQRLDNIEDTLEELKEESAITRSATNTLLEWAEQAQVNVQVPLFKKAE